MEKSVAVDQKQLQWEIDEAFLDFVANGNAKEALDLLKSGKNGLFPNKNATTMKGLSALSLCINKNNEKLFEKLLDTGLDPNYYETNGLTPLMLAVEKRKYNFVEILLSRKDVNLEIEDKFGNTVLFTAIDAGDEGMVKKLLDSGANPSHKNKRHNLPVVLAAQKASIPIMEALINAGADINTKDEYGADLLINALSFISRQKRAATQAQIDLCKFLIEKGADVNYKNNDGANALCVSLMSPVTYQLSSLILDKGANPENLIYRDKLTEQMHPLHFAVILESNMDNHRAIEESTLNSALGIPVQGGAATMILSAPPAPGTPPTPANDPNAGANNPGVVSGDINQNPNAIDENRFPITEKLLKMQVNPNIRDSDGNSPVAYAAIRNHDILKLLLEHGGDPNTFIYQDGKRMPILTKIILDRKEDIYEILRDKGARFDLSGSNNEEDKKFSPFKAALQSGVSAFVADLAKEASLNTLWDSAPEGVSPLAYVLGPYLKADLKDTMTYESNIKTILSDLKGNMNGSVGKNSEELQEQKLLQMRQKQSKMLEFTKLEYALNQSVLKTVDILINNNADVNFPNKLGQTPLFFCQTKQTAEYLVDAKGATFDITDNNGNTPLVYAVKANNRQLIEYLVDKAISLSLQNKPYLKDCVLNLAYSPGDGYYKNSSYVSGFEHLLKYVKSKDENLLKEMLEKRDENGNTPLIISTALEQRTVAKHLLDHNNNVNYQNDAGESAIFHALTSCDVAAVEMLLSKGADVNLKDATGKTVLDCVSKLNNRAMITTFNNHLNATEEKKSGTKPPTP